MPKVEVKRIVVEKDERPENEFLYLFHILSMTIVGFLDLPSIAKLSGTCRYMYTLQKSQEWLRKLFEIEAKRTLIGTEVSHGGYNGMDYHFERVVDIDFTNRYIECKLVRTGISGNIKEESCRFVFSNSHDVELHGPTDYICGYCGHEFYPSRLYINNNKKDCNRISNHKECMGLYNRQFVLGHGFIGYMARMSGIESNRKKGSLLYSIKPAMFTPNCALRYEFNIPGGSLFIDSWKWIEGMSIQWIGLDEILDYRFNSLESLKAFRKFQTETKWDGSPDDIDVDGIIKAVDNYQNPRIVKDVFTELNRKNLKRKIDEYDDQDNVKLAKTQEENVI